MRFKFFLLTVFFFVSSSFGPKENPCGGVERWDVKTLSDPDADKVVMKTTYTTVSKLIELSPGKKIGNKTPRFGVEFNTYTIKCKIKYWSREEDGDIHLVLVDLKDSTKTMIGEIPNLSCDSVASATNKYNKYFVEAEKEFLKYKLSRNRVKSGIYQIKGVAFFDQKHGQKGLAPNGIELHPILKFKKLE